MISKLKVLVFIWFVMVFPSLFWAVLAVVQDDQKLGIQFTDLLLRNLIAAFILTIIILSA